MKTNRVKPKKSTKASPSILKILKAGRKAKPAVSDVEWRKNNIIRGELCLKAIKGVLTPAEEKQLEGLQAYFAEYAPCRHNTVPMLDLQELKEVICLAEAIRQYIVTRVNKLRKLGFKLSD